MYLRRFLKRNGSLGDQLVLWHSAEDFLALAGRHDIMNGFFFGRSLFQPIVPQSLSSLNPRLMGDTIEGLMRSDISVRTDDQGRAGVQLPAPSICILGGDGRFCRDRINDPSAP